MIEAVSEAGHDGWDAYVDSRPDATLYHLSAWSRVARSAYGLRTENLVARAYPGGPIRGVLPLFVVPRPGHRYVTTGVFGAYGPVLADDAATAAELVVAAQSFARDARAGYLHIKALGAAPAAPNIDRQDVWVVATLSLAGGAPRVWKGFKSSIRAAVRQGMRAGFTLRSGRAEIDAFYDVLADNMHRMGAPIYGKAFLHGLCDTLGDRCDVVTLWADGKPVSGAFVARLHGVHYVPFASSRRAYFPRRPNNLLYWRLMERACEAGLHTFDFGSSLRGSSSLAFKLGWGARLTPVASYIHACTPGRPVLDASSPRVQAAIRLWRNLPRPVADAVGPYICRFMV